MAKRELYKEERDVLEGEIRDVSAGGMESYDTLESRGESMATPGGK